MKQTIANFKARIVTGIAAIAIGAICWNGGNSCQAQTPANLSPGLQEVVGLSKAQMADDVVIKYINNSGKSYHLTADDMLYLKGQGVSAPVISALIQAQGNTPEPVAYQGQVPPPQSLPLVPVQQPGPPPEVPPPAAPGAPAPEVSLGYFHDQLSPFGSWVDVGGVQYWHPDAAIQANPDWRPYYDNGKWVQTDNGLFWQSDYTWGDIPFHYGRWVRNPGMGWLWAPDLTWGPSWVFWRHGEQDAAIGWAPLPLGAVFVADGGFFMFNGLRVGADFEFGLGEGVFTFVDYDHFHDGFFRMRGHEFGGHIGGERFHNFYGRSVVRNEFHRDEHGRFVNNGIGRDRMERATHGRVEHSGFQERHPVGDRNKLAGEKAGGKPGEKAGGKAAAAPSKVFRPPAAASKPAAKAPAASGGKKK